MKRATAWLLAKRTDAGLWRYPLADAPQFYDHSCTQYVVLGLKSASRCGIEIPEDVWVEIIRWFANAQEKEGPPAILDRTLENPDGAEGDERYAGRRVYVKGLEARGWGYVAHEPAYGSMTTSGVACLYLAQSELLERGRLPSSLRKDAAQSIDDGMAWLADHYSTAENPRLGEGFYYYYLYGLERAMVFSRTELLGTRDWYRDGALALLRLQSGGGSWGNGLVDTSFALLFLKRATSPIAITGDGR